MKSLLTLSGGLKMVCRKRSSCCHHFATTSNLLNRQHCTPSLPVELGHHSVRNFSMSDHLVGASGESTRDGVERDSIGKKIERLSELKSHASSSNAHDTKIDEDNRPFAQMLRESRFFQMGDWKGQVVVGVIHYTIANDLYIDFGGKFMCVCKRPQQDSEKYHIGAKVLLRINDLELSSRFLGSEKDLTLLEADCVLLGISGLKRRTAIAASDHDQETEKPKIPPQIQSLFDRK